MSYSMDLRTRVVSYVRGGGNQTESAHLFKVSRKTVYLWLQRGDALADLPRKPYSGKLDKAQLGAHVRDYPDKLLRERAAVFGVKPHTIYTALKQQGISYKKNDTL